MRLDAPTPDTNDVSGLQIESEHNGDLLTDSSRRSPLKSEYGCVLEIFLRNRVLRALVLPVNGQDPPAFAVIEKLKTVDAAHERRGIA